MVIWGTLCLSAILFVPSAFAKEIRQPIVWPCLSGKFGDSKLHLTLARTGANRSKGLMFVKKLADNQGMLFSYPKLHRSEFWMKNTPIPLDIAFMDAHYCIQQIMQMKVVSIPKNGAFHYPSYVPNQPYRHALEMNWGWFKAYKVKVGDCLSFVKSRRIFPLTERKCRIVRSVSQV